MSFDDGFILGLSLGGGGSVSGNLRAVIDDDAGTLKIISFTGNEDYNDCIYSLETADYSKTITTHYTSGETTITRAKTFSRKIIKKITNSNNVVILTVDVDNMGRPTAYHDAENVEIHTSEWRSEMGETQNYDAINIDAVAIGYAIAKNTASSEALEEMLKSYRKGVLDGDNGRGEVSEDFDTTDDVTLPIEDNDFTSEPAITDLSKGYWFKFGDTDTGEVTEYVRVWIEPFYLEKSDYWGTYTYKNRPWLSRYSADGTLNSTIALGIILPNEGNIAYLYEDMPTSDIHKQEQCCPTKVTIEDGKIIIYSTVYQEYKNGTVYKDETYRSQLNITISGQYIGSTNVSPIEL